MGGDGKREEGRRRERRGEEEGRRRERGGEEEGRRRERGGEEEGRRRERGGEEEGKEEGKRRGGREIEILNNKVESGRGKEEEEG